MDKLKFNPLSPDPEEAQRSKLKCVDALTCVNAFIHHYRSHNSTDLHKRMKDVFELCDNYGLVPKGNTYEV